MNEINYAAEEKSTSGKLNFSNIIKVLLSRWYWIVGFMILTLSFAYVYLIFTYKTYSTGAIVKLEKSETEITQLLNVNNQAEESRVETETYVIKSAAVLNNAVLSLNYPVSYYLKGKAKNVELYPEKPFIVEAIFQDSVSNIDNLNFEFRKENANEYRLTYTYNKSKISEKYKFGQIVNVGNSKIKIWSSLHLQNEPYIFHFNSVSSVVSRIKNNLTITSSPKVPSIMMLSLTASNPVFAANALNAILDQYLKTDAQLKMQVATQTIDFIDQQLGRFTNQVQNSQTALVKYKQGNNIVDISSTAQELSKALSDQEAQKNILRIQALSIDQLQREINQNSKAVNLNLGLEGEMGSLLAGLIVKMNMLIEDRNNKIKQFDPNSTIVLAIDEQIDNVRNAVRNNIKLLKERNVKTISFIDRQIAETKLGLNNLPTDERNLFNLQNEFDINQKVYSFLSEKKLEAQISKAATVSSATIIEKAKPSFFPISPIPSNIYRNAIMFGLILGVGLIFLVRIINPYIHDQAYVELEANVPILGMIKKYPTVWDPKNITTLFQPKSAFAESIRSVRTNLSFMASDKKSKIVCVTSSVSGEGKSFVSVNLASAISLIEKKVILIAADLRRSRLDESFNVTGKKGLSEYLSHQATLDEIIVKTEVENLFFISSGAFPPNPSELLYSSQMSKLLSVLSENYDYIIIDTAPVGLISDAIPLIKYADVNVFVIRAGVSKKDAVKLPGRIVGEFNLNNACIILNAFEPNNLHASFQTSDFSSGGSYGNYYYTDYSAYSPYYNDEIKEKLWWKKIWN
jgi:capsular exopolysaccharide synthesis family protein